MSVVLKSELTEPEWRAFPTLHESVSALAHSLTSGVSELLTADRGMAPSEMSAPKMSKKGI